MIENFGGSIVYLILFLLGKIDQPGFTTIILIQLFFSGLIMFVVSIISIYVGYILDEVKKLFTSDTDLCLKP